MIGLWGESVVLELAGGRRVTVKLLDLRSESRIQAKELAKTLDTARGQRVEELKGQAVSAAAPAPSPLPQPPAAPAYQPPQANMSADQFLQQLEDSVAAGHVLAMFDSLPPSYRKDVSDLVKLGAQNVDPAKYQSLVTTLHQLGDLIVTRQRWITSSPRMESLDGITADNIMRALLPMAGVLRVGLSPESTQLAKLQSTDFRSWLAERDQVIAPHLAQLYTNIDAEPRMISVDSSKGGEAVVSIESDGNKSKVTYTNVEGFWVPKSLAESWSSTVESKRQAFSEGQVDLDSFTLMIDPIVPLLSPLAQAGNAGEFHGAMEAVFAPAETFATGLASVFGTGFSLASNQRGGGYDDGYDDGYGGYEDEMMDEQEEEMEEDYDGGYGSQ